MNDVFYFSKIRVSIAKENQIMVQGFCTEDLMDGMQVEAVLRDGKENCRLATAWFLSKNLITQKTYIKNKEINSNVTFAVDIPGTISDSAGFRIDIIPKEENGTGKRQTLYKCKGSNIRKAMSEVNACIESVATDGTHWIIKGWAADREEIHFELTGMDGTSLQSALTVDWYMRSDVTVELAECEEPQMAGFVVKMEMKQKKMQLCLQAGNRTCVYKIGGMTGLGSTSALGKIKNYVTKTVDSLRDYDLKMTIDRAKRLIQRVTRKEVKNYAKWIKKKMPSGRELAEQRRTAFAYRPLFSILVPMYETEEIYLKELVHSVQAQTYSNWELCLSDGSKDSSRLRKIVGEMSEKDSRIKYVADAVGPLGISDNTNQALSVAEGDYIVLGDHDDVFTPDALYECVKVLNEKKVDVIYSDEDKIDAKGTTFFEPNFKPDFNIDLLRSNNYICHMFVAAKRLVDMVGGFNKDYDGSQDYDFIFRCVERANAVYHIPKVLYRWRSHIGSTAENPESKLYAFEAGKRAIEAHYKRLGLDATVEHGDDWGFYKTTYAIHGNPLLSIVIPNKDHIADLKKCMDAIDKKSVYRNYEYVIVENNSEHDETFEFYKEISQRKNVQVLYWKGEFNYSEINNFGVEHANGEFILLLNNDTEIINEDCLSQMLGYCQREDVGAVGARLYYEDGTIQHAGVVIGFGGIAGHAFVGLQEESGLYHSRTKVACDYSAVTAACLMTKKSIYEQVGGLEKGFKVAFNDIDFCMKIRELGKLVVYNANAKMHHYESKSRGLEDTPEKLERFNREIRLFHERWPDILEKGDPYYNPNLSLEKADFSFRV